MEILIWSLQIAVLFPLEALEPTESAGGTLPTGSKTTVTMVAL